MDTDNDKRRQELFGNPSKGVIKYKCIQCASAIEGQTEKRYQVCGNYCNKCGRKYTEGNMTSLERIRTKKRIEELEKLNERLSTQLDLEISEDTRQFIEDKMHANYTEKKTLIELLCKPQDVN
jgi:DNA-directed RNA polymerase subunit RPC12/RpoP